MDWFGAGSNGPLMIARAIHFAATAVTAGSLIFGMTMARPALLSKVAEARPFRTQILAVAWVSLAIAVASGVSWFLFQAVAMSGAPLDEVIGSDVWSTVLNETQFGRVSQLRIMLAVILAVCLAGARFAAADWLALSVALGLTVAVTWTGHAGSTPGEMGNLHLIADGLHLVAAAAWIGGLVPLVLLLVCAQRTPSAAWATLVEGTLRRFSTLGIVSVLTLLATGTVNAWILVGSFQALAATDYGRLLMLKIVVFAAMLVFAALNRLWLTPRLVSSSENESQVELIRQLTRNSAIEIGLGFTIFVIVGMLGTMHPAIHL
jgi:copper resistance protein D